MKSIQELHIPNLEVIPDNYECDICHDKGHVIATPDDYQYLTDDPLTLEPVYLKDCICRIKRNFKINMRASGLSFVDGLSFDNYVTKYDWQKDYLNKAMLFRKQPKSLFFMSGGTGSGKTRLSSTLFKYLVFGGLQASYMLWEREIAKGKDNYRAVDMVNYSVWAKIPLLYIDDFLKCPGNDISKITDFELSLARSLINERYNNKKLITLISTELSDTQLKQLDASMFGRLQEMATKDFMIFMDPKADRDMRREIFEKGELK